MKKLLILLFSLLIVFVVGCSSKTFSSKNLERIDIYELDNGTELKLNTRISLTDPEEIKQFINAINKSEKSEELTFEPNYQVELTNLEGSFFLSLNETQGYLVRANDESESYILSENSVVLINNLISNVSP
ncbi:hypothetical protein [Ureibacillus acetophenoni]|uniref:YhfM-like domain-containing protein n=1 Tax=Ureibacillus acetophenoni TaxID=614649 RepID=A0A285UPQ7_9BACL|nr:hypothetical protein [Ureibacillus acetophenoni]SOC43874.1 hypothetical protein SAMN05877842_11783 [Ureibacillus acetophenoni]